MTNNNKIERGNAKRNRKIGTKRQIKKRGKNYIRKETGSGRRGEMRKYICVSI